MLPWSTALKLGGAALLALLASACLSVTDGGVQNTMLATDTEPDHPVLVRRETRVRGAVVSVKN